MSERSSEATQADADAQSQVDDATNDSATQADAQETLSRDEAKKLRSEAASLRKRLKDAEGKVQAAENAGRSEDEKRAAALTAAEKRATEAEDRLRRATGKAAVVSAATTANAIDTNAVWALARDDLEYGDDGEPTNLAEVLAAIQGASPRLFRKAAGRGDGGSGNDDGNRSGGTKTMNQLIARRVRRGGR